MTIRSTLTRRPIRWVAQGLSRLAEALRRRWPALVRSPLGRPVEAFLARRLVRSGVFDAAGYACKGGPDRSLTPAASARAYLRRWPPPTSYAQPLFDAELYRTHAGLGPRTDALTHYAVCARSTGAPFNRRFDPQRYLAANPDLRVAGVDPVRHFLLRGRFENRGPDDPPPMASSGSGDNGLDWSRLRPRPAGATARASVIVPVHGARAQTLLCLHRLLSAANALPYQVVVIDDASPDAELRHELAGLRDQGLIELIVNEDNLGFSATVNRGLERRRDGAVVLLNSDTEVFDHWLDRLHRVAVEGERVGTVTPLSNAATILSYPVRLRDNPASLEIDWRTLDAVVSSLGSAPVAIPTAVGFCMYIARGCLNETGPLDARAFPRGYGEENDFCLRAAALGWRHMAATDTFVAHSGAASFGSARDALIEAGLSVLAERYPGYRGQVDAFIRRDPLATVRAAIDIERIRRMAISGRLVHALDRPPDGAGDDLALVFDPSSGGFLVRSAVVPVTPNTLCIDILHQPQDLAALLAALGVTTLVLEDPYWIGRRRTAALRDIAAQSGAEFFLA